MSISLNTIAHMQPEIDLLRRAFDYAGFTLALTPLPPVRALQYAASGSVDGDFMRESNGINHYPTLLAIDVPLKRAPLWVQVLEGAECPAGPEQLSDLKTVTVLGYHYFDAIEQIAASERVQTKDVLSALRVLQAGRVDFLVLVKTVMTTSPKATGIALKSCFKAPLAVVDFYTAIHIKHRDKLPRLEAGLRRALAERP